jgi:hypothetical protein
LITPATAPSSREKAIYLLLCIIPCVYDDSNRDRRAVRTPSGSRTVSTRRPSSTGDRQTTATVVGRPTRSAEDRSRTVVTEACRGGRVGGRADR